MKLKVFGIAREIMDGKEVTIDASLQTVAELRSFLLDRYPKLKDLNSIMIAVNLKYASDEVSLSEADEIAVIPPVNGG